MISNKQSKQRSSAEKTQNEYSVINVHPLCLKVELLATLAINAVAPCIVVSIF